MKKSERERGMNAPWVFEIDLFWHYYCHPSLDLPSLLFVSRTHTHSLPFNIFDWKEPYVTFIREYVTRNRGAVGWEWKVWNRKKKKRKIDLELLIRRYSTVLFSMSGKRRGNGPFKMTLAQQARTMSYYNPAIKKENFLTADRKGFNFYDFVKILKGGPVCTRITFSRVKTYWAHP